MFRILLVCASVVLLAGVAPPLAAAAPSDDSTETTTSKSKSAKSSTAKTSKSKSSKSSTAKSSKSSAAGTSGTCSQPPAKLLDLENWYIGLPIGEGSKPKNVKQPELAGYCAEPWFTTSSDGKSVQFRASVKGVTTKNSKNPRSELREMKGKEEAAWSGKTGTHTMTIKQKVTHLPTGKPHLVVGQIHGGSDDVAVFRVEGKKLYLTNGDNAHYKVITEDFQLNTEFEVKFEVKGGKINAYYNGQLKDGSLPANFSGAYFKAGAYTQANCSNASPCAESNYGEVLMSALKVEHTG